MNRRQIFTGLAGAALAAPMLASAQSMNTLMDVIAGSRDLTRFAAIVRQAGVEAQFRASAARYTVFAPANGAYGLLSADALRRLETDADYRRTTVLNHIAESQQMLLPGGNMDAFMGQTFAMRAASGLTLRVEHGTTGLPSVNGLRIIVSNVAAGNGLLHSLEGFILPA